MHSYQMEKLKKIVTFLKNNGGPSYSDDIIEKIEKANSTDQELEADEEDDTDEFLMDAIDMAVNMDKYQHLVYKEDSK